MEQMDNPSKTISMANYVYDPSLKCKAVFSTTGALVVITAFEPSSTIYIGIHATG